MPRWPKDYVREERNGTLFCNACELWLDKKKFKSPGARAKGKLHTMCNGCLYLKYTKPYVDKKTAVVQQYKLGHGCTDCGYNKHPAALEFDHLPGTEKKFNIMEQIGGRSMDAIMKEIAKCEVVCANCHAIRTTERRQDASGSKLVANV